MAFPHEIKEMKLAGMNAAISKPIEAKEVYMALEKFLVIFIRLWTKKKRTMNFQRMTSHTSGF